VCLAIPGKIIEISDHDGSRMARVQFGGIVRSACLDFCPEAQKDDYVMVHVGFAISRVNTEEAQRTYQILEEMDLLNAELPAASEEDI